MRHVALLRGINVGGKHRVPMAELRELFVRAGCRDVETYIQSGNVVFGATAAALPKLALALPKQMEKAFGFPIPLVLRTAEELEQIVKRNPYPDARESDKLHVVFLRDLPTKAAATGLDPNRSPGDSFTILGRDLFVKYANGAGKTKLTNTWLDAQLGTVSTARNWRTVLELRGMASR